MEVILTNKEQYDRLANMSQVFANQMKGMTQLESDIIYNALADIKKQMDRLEDNMNLYDSIEAKHIKA